MLGTSLPPSALPRASVLTRALMAPTPILLGEELLAGYRRHFREAVAEAARGLAPGRRLRIDGYRLRAPTREHGTETPFAWTPWTARRQIGLESVKTWLADPSLSAVHASREVMARLTDEGDDPRGRSRSLSRWLMGLSQGARAVVQAEVITWTTQLMTALDWELLERPVIGADRSILVDGASDILLKGRMEVRSEANVEATGESSEIRPVVIFAVLTGRPGPTARAELGLNALTLALDHRHRMVPVRAVGWWPQCGRALVVPVDLPLLHRTLDAVVEAVRLSRRESPTTIEGVRSRQVPDLELEPALRLERVAS